MDKTETLNVPDTILLASGLFDDGHYEEAEKLYRAADEAGGGFRAINGLGMCLNELDRPKEALVQFDRAYLLMRDEMAALASNRARALLECGRAEEAMLIYNGLMKSAPHNIFRYNRALAMLQLCKHEEAIKEFNTVIEAEPDNDKAKFGRGFAYLALGDYEHGFKDYECRLKDDIESPCTEWTGEQSLSGKTILVHADMGLGDNIMFMRYLPLMVERGAKVIAVLPDSQKFLCDGLEGVEHRTINRDTWPKLDYWVRFMSLGWCFRTKRETIPPPVKINYRPEMYDKWRKIIGDGFSVGLCWAGNTKSKYDAHRTIALKHLSPLYQMSGVKFFSLNKEIRDTDRKVFEKSGIIDLAPHIETFEDTANAMRCLHLMITVDTSVAHMAGTVGIPTWVMLTSYRTYWLWIKSLTTSPWYPSIRTFSQIKDGEWNPVVSEICKKIREPLQAVS